MGRIKFDAGLGYRRRARAAAEFYGLEVKEFKGLVRSSFVMTGPDDAVLKMLKWVEARIVEREVT